MTDSSIHYIPVGGEPVRDASEEPLPVVLPDDGEGRVDSVDT